MSRRHNSNCPIPLITRLSSTHVQFLVQRLFHIQFSLFLTSLEDQRACIRAINLAATHFRGDWPVPPKCSRNTPIQFFFVFLGFVFCLIYFCIFYICLLWLASAYKTLPDATVVFCILYFLCYASLNFCILCNVFFPFVLYGWPLPSNTPEIPWRDFSLAMP